MAKVVNIEKRQRTMTTVLELDHLSKTFAGQKALDDAHLGIRPVLLGEEVSLPVDGSRRHLLHLVHQDLGLVDSLSVVDNIGLSESYQVGRFHKIDWGHSRDRAHRALEPFGLAHLDLKIPVGELTASQRAVVAIARDLIGWEGQSSVLVLDETTAALPRDEVKVLVEARQRLTARGAGILYITHRLDEAFQFTDRVSILHDAGAWLPRGQALSSRGS